MRHASTSLQGAGHSGEAAAKYERQFILIDNNLQAIEVMEKRLARFLSPDANEREDNRTYQEQNLILQEA